MKAIKLKKFRIDYRTLVFILAILAFLIRAFPIDLSYFFWDETVYLLNAEYFASGSAPYTEIITRPPFLSFILSPFTENIEIFSRLILSLLNSLLIPVVYLLGKELNKKIGLMSSFFVAFFPFHIMAGKWIMTDALSALFISLTVLLFWKGLKNNKTIFTYLGAFFLGISILTKFTNLILFIILLPLIIYFRKNYSKRNILISFFIFIITVLPYLIFNYKLFDSMFYTFERAFHVVRTAEPVSFLFTLFSIYDFFGIIILLFFVLGIYNIIKKKELNFQYFLIFWSLFSLIFYIILLQRGVAKPLTIEWEVERFLFPAFIPIIIIASYSIQRFFKKTSYIYIIIIIFILLNIPAYSRAYIPAIEHENGLREVTKELGLYIKENTEEEEIVHCITNCPVLAYYSKRKIKIMEEGDEFDYLAVISKPKTLNYKLIKEIKKKDWVAYLYKNE